MNYIIGFVLLFFVSNTYAEEDCAANCTSQLLRVEISPNVLSNGGAANLLPSLNKLAESPTLQSLIQQSYTLQDIGFPQSDEACEREKSDGDPDFKNIDCKAPGLCSKTDLKHSVREKICFKLPCPIFEGTLNPGKCKEVKDIYPVGISFPGTLDITKIRLQPTKVEYKNGAANLCFRMNELELKMNTNLTLDTANTTLPDKSLDISNINPVLDKPRDICISANLNLASPTPVSNIKIEPQGIDPFISDNVIRTAATKLKIGGLSGYPPEALATIQSEVVPVIIQPLRSSIEAAVKDSLAKVFQDQIQTMAAPFIKKSDGSSSVVDSRNLMSELGLHNILVKDQLAILECAVIKNAGKPIPPKHDCVGMQYWGKPIPEGFDPSTSFELSRLNGMIKGNAVTSESIKQRLIALKDGMREEKLHEIFMDGTPESIARMQVHNLERINDDIKTYLDPLIKQIEDDQLKHELYKFVEIQNRLNNGLSGNLGISLPEICTPKPSPHANRKIKNCPIQVYADLNEFNIVLKKMWETGRMCMKGQGQFNPEKDEWGRPAYNPEGKPLAKGGCYFEVEGLGCYIKTPPQIKYDTKLKKYKVNLPLQSCYRGPVFLGIGKIGGDLNIDFSFDPKACNNGDFCMEKPDVKWEVVPGTERFALRQSSLFNGIVTDKLNEAMSGAMKNTIRLPMASGVGPLANIPLQAEGRVDSGPGFFGACLEIPKEARPE